MGELVGEGSLAVAVGVGDGRQVTFDMVHVTCDIKTCLNFFDFLAICPTIRKC